jgi:hypothetical protein
MLDLTPHASAGHWSARFVGRPWTEQYTCWELVRDVQASCFGREVPLIPDAADARAALLAALMRGGAWQPLAEPMDAADGDVAVMRGPDGVHVGVTVRLNGRAEVLHNLGSADTGGAVRRDALDELGRLGYGHLTVWRCVG